MGLGDCTGYPGTSVIGWALDAKLDRRLDGGMYMSPYERQQIEMNKNNAGSIAAKPPRELYDLLTTTISFFRSSIDILILHLCTTTLLLTLLEDFPVDDAKRKLSHSFLSKVAFRIYTERMHNRALQRYTTFECLSRRKLANVRVGSHAFACIHDVRLMR